MATFNPINKSSNHSLVQWYGKDYNEDKYISDLDVIMGQNAHSYYIKNNDDIITIKIDKKYAFYLSTKYLESDGELYTSDIVSALMICESIERIISDGWRYLYNTEYVTSFIFQILVTLGYKVKFEHTIDLETKEDRVEALMPQFQFPEESMYCLT